MPKFENITPERMISDAGACDTIFRLEDGRLLISGPHVRDVKFENDTTLSVDLYQIRAAIVIPEDLLAEYVEDKVKRALDARRAD